MAESRKKTRDLERYRAKRSAGQTPEPFGGERQRPHLFVVQQHAARQRHFDFRLEWQGVLLSWAVPRGPCLDPSVKRLAVHVEDHPVEYADFEGSIPEGNYGAGAVIVWDRGRWFPVEDPGPGLERGKLLFDLEGHKLRGRWTLVRSGRAAREGASEWLLIKKSDAFARAQEEAAPEGFEASVLSGLTLEQRAEGTTPGPEIERRLKRAKVTRGRVEAAEVRPMLAERCDAPFSRPGWLFEIKYDGYRAIASSSSGEPRLRSRNGRDLTGRFPEIAIALAAFPYPHLVIDGELVVSDREGRPDFARLQQRASLSRPREIDRASVELPATLFAFDLLGFGDFDLRDRPLVERKALLRQLVPQLGPVRYATHFEERGEEVYAQVSRLGFEGMLAKQADSRYVPRRSPSWKKFRVLATEDFVIVGYTNPRGARQGLGSLHLAAYSGDSLTYCGRVGSGLSESELRELHARLEVQRRPDPPCGGPIPQTRGHVWVEPEQVCEVRYAEVTREGLLRQPVFVRMRDDKAPRECKSESEALLADDQPVHSVAPAVEDARRIEFTNLDKVFWPEEEITKGDLIEYHRAIAPWLLPYLEARPLVLTRYPDGIEGKSFFQKDAPSWAPEWVRTERLWSEHGGREIRYFMIDDVDALLYVINMGTIPLHVWSSCISTLATPDWCILDLDPKGAPFADVIRVAREIHRICEEIELPNFVKTSGSSGLHVLVPLGRQLTYEQSRTLGQLIGRLVVARLPEIATLTRRVQSRGGKVYVDVLQNGHGRLLVAPFSARPLPGAPVSMPLRWSEVNARLEIGRYTIRNAVRRMKRLAGDPLRPVLSTCPDVIGALERLATQFSARSNPSGD